MTANGGDARQRRLERLRAYEALLRDLARFVGVEPPGLESDDPRAVRRWTHRTRRLVDKAVTARAGTAPEEWYGPLIAAAVHEPDPSFVCDLVWPAMAAFGRRRVRISLLEHLETGASIDAAGAARAWYCTLNPRHGDADRSRRNTTHDDDLQDRFAATALRRFVTDADPAVRACLIQALHLVPDAYPPDLHALVATAIEIARNSDDTYVRRRLDVATAPPRSGR